MVEAQKLESSDSGSGDERGCEVNGVEGPNWLARERFARAVHDLWPQSEDVPMRCGRGQMGASVCDLRFREFTKRGRPMEDPVALNEREVRGQHGLGLRQGLAHECASRFVEQPREYGA